MSLFINQSQILAKTLFDFLQSLTTGHPAASMAITTDQKTLRQLYSAPPQPLTQALTHLVDSYLVQITPDPAQWGVLSYQPAVWGYALALRNILAPAPNSAAAFTAALLSTLPPAANRAEGLVIHAMLHPARSQTGGLPPPQQDWLRRLVDRNPLSALAAPHLANLPTLHPLAAELLPGFKAASPAERLWPAPDRWLDAAVDLLAQPDLRRWLREAWLTLPETSTACRNLGLILESLRRQGVADGEGGVPPLSSSPHAPYETAGFIGDQRETLLTFYEAYDYFKAVENGGGKRSWPVFATLRKLLQAAGDNEMSLALNRRGNACFLKFYPLLAIIRQEGGIPPDYYHLTRAFVKELQAVQPYTSLHSGSSVKFGDVSFESQSAQPD